MNFLLKITPWLVASFFSRAQSPSFSINGTIGKLDTPSRIYLVRNQSITESILLKKGKFEFKGTCNTFEKITLFIQRSGQLKELNLFSPSLEKIDFFIESGSIRLVSADSLSNAVISGSRLADENNQLLTTILPIRKQEQSIERAYARNKNWEQDTAFQRAIDAKRKIIHEDLAQKYTQFISHNPNSRISLSLLEELTNWRGFGYARLAPAYQSLNTNLKTSVIGLRIAEWLTRLKLVSTGEVAPDFTLRASDGKLISLHSLRGRYVLLEFWASWCGPCRAGFSELRKTYQRFGGKNFDIICISLDTSQEEWGKAIQEEKLPWVQVSDLLGTKAGVARQYCIESIPDSYLLAPDGRIIHSGLRGNYLSERLAKLLQ